MIPDTAWAESPIVRATPDPKPDPTLNARRVAETCRSADSKKRKLQEYLDELVQLATKYRNTLPPHQQPAVDAAIGEIEKVYDVLAGLRDLTPLFDRDGRFRKATATSEA